MGNMPRVDPDTMHGIMTDASIKRRVRDYVSLFKTGEPGMDIFVEAGVNNHPQTWRCSRYQRRQRV